MNRFLITLFFIIFSSSNLAVGEEEMILQMKESRAVIQEFAGQLKARLKSAIKEDGSENAVEVCNIAAPEIASTLSEKYNWVIGRTSLKTRNAKNNPDSWEKQVLEQFEQQKQQGADISKLDHYENTTVGFRYMKAIPTQELCLTCHGESFSEPLKAKLSKLYPNDQATGFKVGDIRGAFSILHLKK